MKAVSDKLLRPLWVAAAAVLFVLAAGLLLVIYNAFDEPLDSDTVAWLSYPVPTADPAKNGFLDQITLDSRSHLPRMAAQDWLHAAHAMHENDVSHALSASPETFDRLYRHFIFPQDFDTPPIADCMTGCYGDILAKRSVMETSARALAPLLGRYDSMLVQPDYAEDLIPDLAAVGLGLAQAPRLDRLYVSRMVYRLEDGQGEMAYADWERRQLFWRRVAGQAVTLYSQMQALVALERGNHLLAEMLLRHPESLSLARSQVMPALAELPLQAQFARALVHQLRYAQDGYTQVGIGSWLEHHADAGTNNIFSGFGGLVGVSLYQPRATLNMARRLSEDGMATLGLSLDGKALRHFPADRQICATWRGQMPVTPANPFGKYLACRAAGSFLPLLGRLQANAATTRQLESALGADVPPERARPLLGSLPTSPEAP